MKLGIDVGGTFTDFVFLDQQGEIRFSKVLTTYPPEEGVRQGIAELRANLGQFAFLAHSTTLGLNAYITGKGARTGLVTTTGFRDTLEIARTRRLHLYDLFQEKPERVLVPRYLRFEVTERLDRDGKTVTPLDEQEVRTVARKLRQLNVEAIAVCLIHSYTNSRHEQRVRELLAKECPTAFLSISSEILPEYREYERTFVTTVNAFIGPIMQQYFETTDRIFGEAGYRGESYISQSNGGLMSTRAARAKPVYTIGSGPASGVVGGILIGGLTGFPDIICMDMGGTTCLVSLVQHGAPTLISETRLENRLKLPQIDVHTIGAGGGSIAWVDAQGAPHVGPQSAAASPGPACYGFGGKDPTVTDANLLLGYLDPKFYLGGRMAVHPDKSRVALKPVADALGLDLLEAALSIQKIVEANMVNNLSEVSVWRGYDPREFAFIAFGGGAGLHALNMAAELGIRAVISPAYPAIVSALGHLVSDLKHFYSRTYVALIEDAGLDTINNFYAGIEREAQRTLRKEMTERGDIRLLRSIDMRYQWQLHELNVPTGRAPLRRADLRGLKQRFNKKHEEAYGYALPTYPVEIVALRLEAIGNVQAIQFRRREPAPSAKADHAVRGTRDTYLPKTGRTRLKAYDRERLKPGTALQGPALVDGLEATILVPEQWQVTLDGYQNLMMERA